MSNLCRKTEIFVGATYCYKRSAARGGAAGPLGAQLLVSVGFRLRLSVVFPEVTVCGTGKNDAFLKKKDTLFSSKDLNFTRFLWKKLTEEVRRSRRRIRRVPLPLRKHAERRTLERFVNKDATHRDATHDELADVRQAAEPQVGDVALVFVPVLVGGVDVRDPGASDQRDALVTRTFGHKQHGGLLCSDVTRPERTGRGGVLRKKGRG